MQNFSSLVCHRSAAGIYAEPCAKFKILFFTPLLFHDPASRAETRTRKEPIQTTADEAEHRLLALLNKKPWSLGRVGSRITEGSGIPPLASSTAAEGIAAARF